MSHFILPEDAEHKLWRAKRILLLVADLADAAPKGPVFLDSEALSALCHTLAESIPDDRDLPFTSGDPL
jgi:hypothetical protein